MKQSIDIKTVGKRVQVLRKRKKLTLDVLAQLSGVSKGYLSRVENGQHTPSFSVLLKISRALSIQLNSLLEEESDSSPFIVTRVADRKGLVFDDGKRSYTQWALAASVQFKRMEPQLLEIPFNDDTKYEHNDERFIYVLEGRIQIMDGQILEKDDCAYITPNTPHSAISIGDKKAKVLLVSCF